MINLEYDRSKNRTKVEIEKFSILDDEDFPVIVEYLDVVSKKVDWSTEVFKNGWASYDGGSVLHDVRVISKTGKEVFYFKFNVELHGDSMEKLMWYFIKSLKHRPRGLVIGSHDGKFGHWIFPVMNDMTDVVMVDGSSKQLEDLKENYSDKSNVIQYINEIITPNGEDVDWYEGGEGFTDTVKPEVIKQFLSDDKITITRRSSIGINDLISSTLSFLGMSESDTLDWLHLDVEGLDSQLIMAMEHRPTLIMFEYMHLDQQQRMFMLDWFESNGYRMYTDFLNAIAVKKNLESNGSRSLQDN